MAAPTYLIDEKLKEWATETQAKYIDAVNKHRSMRAAARDLGVNFGTIYGAIRGVKKKAAIFNYSPEHHMTRPIAPGLKLRGTSNLYKPGEAAPRLEWVKTSVDDDAREEILREFALSLANDIKPLPPIKPPNASLDGDLLCVYPMGDPHFGMYAWWEEAGENFDLDIAERLTCGAIDRLVASAPPAKTALLLNLGDMFHADNQNNTSKSGHALDVDGRWPKVQQVGLRASIYCAKRLLERHERLILRINRGNHDGHSSYALSLMLSCYFSDEPRIEVDLSPAPVWYYRFGSVLIGSTHGDTVKGPDMVSVMAADRPAEWGETKHRHWYVGHVHHQEVKEYRGGTVEYFRTLAARDAWHAGQGYRAGRDMRLIVHHREFGEIERHRCDAAMVAV